ncbi:hypothetical protein CEXT_186721 [Caerostris extrusa]|uniref:Uncharacterized protein n=1 Tax=Caerostris extrusa TaxID=172846 RepID=A0AAV4YCJ4_CAEEX|nr:hypothetical protein CEXT_186721 [Caerostris extrusa]
MSSVYVSGHVALRDSRLAFQTTRQENYSIVLHHLIASRSTDPIINYYKDSHSSNLLTGAQQHLYTEFDLLASLSPFKKINTIIQTISNLLQAIVAP